MSGVILNPEHSFIPDDNEVVERSRGFEYTRGEFRRLFDLVSPKGDWKGAIDALVDPGPDRYRHGLRQAVIFYTGSVPKITITPQGKFRVVAAGYYASVGA